VWPAPAVSKTGLVGTAISPGFDLFDAKRDRPIAPQTWKTERFIMTITRTGRGGP
jgi:hypothetical protein